MTLPLQKISHRLERFVSMKRLVPSLLFTCLWGLGSVTGVSFFKCLCLEGCLCRWRECVKQGSLKEVLWIMQSFVGKETCMFKALGDILW